MIRVKFEGGDELAKALGALSERMSRKVVRAALVEAAEPMRQAIETNAPRRPGKPDIADHIIVSNARPEDGAVGVAVGPASPFFYGGFNELGTSHQPARPFVRPGFDANISSAVEIMSDEMWDALRSRGIGLFSEGVGGPVVESAGESGGGLGGGRAGRGRASHGRNSRRAVPGLR